MRTPVFRSHDHNHNPGVRCPVCHRVVNRKPRRAWKYRVIVEMDEEHMAFLRRVRDYGKWIREKIEEAAKG